MYIKKTNKIIYLAGLDISGLTVQKVLAENGIHRRKPTGKPALSLKQKAARLAFCLEYRYHDWEDVVFTDESYFETGALRSRRARGVLRRAGEAFLPQNLNHKFAQGATVMFWGAILYGYKGKSISLFIIKYIYKCLKIHNTNLHTHTGSELPYHLYPTPYETKSQQATAVVQLRREWEEEKVEVERFNLTPQGRVSPRPLPELKERGKGRKGGIDWFIYRERIQTPLLYPFTVAARATRPGIVIMEDNAPAHIHHYHNAPREKLGLRKLAWPASSPDLNPIETIWTEMKDRVKERLGIRITVAGIRQVVEEEWANYPLERINHHILSMHRRIEACIDDNGGNNFNF